MAYNEQKNWHDQPFCTMVQKMVHIMIQKNGNQCQTNGHNQVLYPEVLCVDNHLKNGNQCQMNGRN